MDPNFALFCLTVIALVALALGRDRLAQEAVDALASIAGGVGKALEQVLKRLSVE